MVMYDGLLHARAKARMVRLYYDAFLASSKRLLSLRSRPFVTRALGSKLANRYLQAFSMNQQPT